MIKKLFYVPLPTFCFSHFYQFAKFVRREEKEKKKLLEKEEEEEEELRSKKNKGIMSHIIPNP